MKKALSWLLLFLLGVISVSPTSRNAAAHVNTQDRVMMQSVGGQQSGQTLTATVTASVPAAETPQARVMPPVGSNAGLVIGASVLVLIVIGGVLGTRRRRNH